MGASNKNRSKLGTNKLDLKPNTRPDL